MAIHFGTLLEIVEDWIRNNAEDNRIMVRIVDGEDEVKAVIDNAYFVQNDQTIFLVVRHSNHEDVFDDKGILLNDPTPSGMYRDLKRMEDNNVDYTAPIEIELWFSDQEDDIQYRLQCHQYFVSRDKLVLMHFLDREGKELEDEFRSFLKEQY